MNHSQQIGISNANQAFDQAGAYDSLQASIDSHLENIQDTLIDEGILTDANLYAAHEAFDARLAALRG